MNIRIDVIGSVRTTLAYWGSLTRAYYDSRPAPVMPTATRVNFWGDTVGIWSAL